MPSVRIWLCGGLRIETGDGHVEDRLTRRKSRELLALLVDSGQAVGREQLIERLWPEAEPGSRAGALRQLLTEIRQCLGPDVLAGRDEIRLQLPADAWVDVAAAERASDEARLALAERRFDLALAHAASARDLLAGELLPGMTATWIDDRRRELEQVELGALETAALAALGEPGLAREAVRAARQLVAAAPFRESGYALLMRALVAVDDPAEALRVYEQLRVLLRDELGTTPSVKLSALHVWVLEHATDGVAAPAAVTVQPESGYARRPDGVSIAYQVLGAGPLDLVIVPGFMSHLDLQWTDPAYRAWLRRLAGSARVVTLDKSGSGASDPGAGPATVEDWAGDVLAVLDAVGSSRAVLLGVSEAGPVTLHLAHAHPDRVTGLILYATLARSTPAPHYLWEHRDELRAGNRRFADVERDWGSGSIADLMAPEAATEAQRRAWAIFERASGSPAAVAERVRASRRLDACSLLSEVAVPTLVLHRTGDRLVSVRHGRHLGAAIPGARYVELPGSGHVPYLGEPDEVEALTAAILDFLAGAPRPALAR